MSAAAGGAGRPRTPCPPAATARCARRAARSRRALSWSRWRSPWRLEEGERLQAPRPVALSAPRRDLAPRQPQAVALAEPLGLQHPLAQDREPRLEVGRARIVEVQHQLARCG